MDAGSTGLGFQTQRQPAPDLVKNPSPHGEIACARRPGHSRLALTISLGSLRILLATRKVASHERGWHCKLVRQRYPFIADWQLVRRTASQHSQCQFQSGPRPRNIRRFVGSSEANSLARSQRTGDRRSPQGLCRTTRVEGRKCLAQDTSPSSDQDAASDVTQAFEQLSGGTSTGEFSSAVGSSDGVSVKSYQSDNAEYITFSDSEVAATNVTASSNAGTISTTSVGTHTGSVTFVVDFATGAISIEQAEIDLGCDQRADWPQSIHLFDAVILRYDPCAQVHRILRRLPVSFVALHFEIYISDQPGPVPGFSLCRWPDLRLQSRTRSGGRL